jgi:hypothetical protein
VRMGTSRYRQGTAKTVPRDEEWKRSIYREGMAHIPSLFYPEAPYDDLPGFVLPD